MKTNKRLILCSILSIILLLCACGADMSVSQNEEASADAYEAAAEVKTETDDGNSSPWHPALFEEPSTQYNNKLALVAAYMSCKAEDVTGEGITGLFSDYGFDHYKPYHYGESGAFAIGHDTLSIDGVDTTVLVIVARGTETRAEGIGDLCKGWIWEKTHDFLGQAVWDNVYDFEEQIWEGLEDYLGLYRELTYEEDLKILVTGTVWEVRRLI